jgi:hypothetical protein
MSLPRLEKGKGLEREEGIVLAGARENDFKATRHRRVSCRI